MWEDLLDERNKRANATFASTAPRSFFDNSSDQQNDDDDDRGGFFGHLLHPVKEAIDTVGAAGKAVGGFFGDVAKDIADTTVTAAKTVEGIGEGIVDPIRANKKIDAADRLQKQITDDLNSGEISKHDYDVKIQDVHRLRDDATDILKNNSVMDLDAKKSAAATAETFLNVATLGGAGAAKSVGKTGIKEGVEAVAEKGGKAALKTVGRNVGEGAAFGGAYGGLDTVKNNPNASGGDILKGALTGAGIGGVGGAAGSLLDKNVRDSIKTGAGDVRDQATNVANRISLSADHHPAVLGFDDQYQQLAKRYDNTTDPTAKKQISQAMAENRQARLQTADSIKQGGYVRIPGSAEENQDWLPGLTPSVDEAADQQLIAQTAQDYSSPEQFLDDVTRSAKSIDDDGRGGDLVPDGEGGYKRTSSHNQWYSTYYKENGRKPSLTATREAVQDALDGKSGGHPMVSDADKEIYQQLKERAGATDALVSDPDAAAAGLSQATQGLPADADELQAMLTGKDSAVTLKRSRMPGGLPKGPQGTAPLNGLEPEAGTLQPRFDSEADLQAALGRGEAQTNPLVDYIDPRARTAEAPTNQADLQVGDTNPYAGMEADLTRPTLPQGELPAPPTSGQARRMVQSGKDAPTETLDVIKPGTKTIELPANIEDTRDVATKTTEGGKVVPVATNNAHPTNGFVDAVKAIADDDTGSAFTATRTPEMNIEEALRKRGGTESPLFKELNQNNVELREATARHTQYMDDRMADAESFTKEFGWTKKMDEKSRQILEASDEELSNAVAGFRNEFGAKATQGALQLRSNWRAAKDVLRTDANTVIERYAGADRVIGDLGENYVPRVYKRPGLKGFRDSVLDVAHSGLDKIGGKDGLINLENPMGYMSKETETAAGTGLRSVNQAPLNSNLAKPNTQFLSAAQKRTAQDPQGELEGSLASIMRYYDAVNRAKEMTPVIAKGRSQQKVIELVNGEKGNLRQMYDSLNDQINAISGKTSSFDTKLVNTKTGNDFVRVATKLQSRVARSTILGSANSALAQTGQLPLVLAENGPRNFQQGMADVFKYARAKVSPLDESPLMKTRYPDSENPFTLKKSTRAGNKATDVVAKPFRVIEQAASKLAWYSSYNRAVTTMGLTGREAITEADRLTAKIIGERSPGARAALYESKALGPVTSYTLEVNQMYQVAKQYAKRDPKKALALVGAIWLYNQGYKAVTGNKLNADPIAAVTDAANILGTSEDANGDPVGLGERLARAGGRIVGEGVDATPLGGQLVGQLYPENGFRVPFGGGDRMLSRADIFGDTNLGRYGGGPPIAAGISNPLLLLGVPGGAQLQRSVEGKRAVDQGGVFSSDGDAKFEIANNQENMWRALLFGQYGTPEGRAYLADQQARLAGR